VAAAATDAMNAKYRSMPQTISMALMRVLAARKCRQFTPDIHVRTGLVSEQKTKAPRTRPSTKSFRITCCAAARSRSRSRGEYPKPENCRIAIVPPSSEE